MDLDGGGVRSAEASDTNDERARLRYSLGLYLAAACCRSSRDSRFSVLRAARRRRRRQRGSSPWPLS